MTYNYRAGMIIPFTKKFYKQLIIAVAAIFIATFAMLTLLTHAVAPPNWTVNAPSTIDFNCGGSYVHTLDTVVQGTGGNFTGTGHYNVDSSFTWNATGNVSGDVLSMTITYTGTSAGSVYNLTNGAVAPNGSVAGNVDSNCTSFTMPAGSLSAFSIPSNEVDVYGNTGTENQQDAWMFNRDATTSTPFVFSTEQASLGNGSVHVLPIGTNASDKFIAEFFAKTKISEVSSFKYDFKVGTGGNAITDADQFYLNVYANFGSSSADKFYDCRYDVVPTTSSGWTTVTFDPTLSYPVTTSGSSPYACPSSPAGMDLLSPNSTIRAFAINVGDTSASDVGLDGFVDKAVFATVSGTTTYDFEPRVVSNKEECKNGGWMLGLADGRKFKNQGDCVSFFATKEKNKPAGI